MTKSEFKPSRGRSAASEISEPLPSEQVSQDTTLLGGYAYQLIVQQFERISKLRPEVLADEDLEPLHQMRVSARRLRSALGLFEDVIAPTPQVKEKSQAQLAESSSGAFSQKQLLKPVRKLTQALGNVRDLDVMQAWFQQWLEIPDPKQTDSKQPDPKQTESEASNRLAELSKKERKIVKALVKKLKKRRQKQFVQLKKLLKGSAYKKLTQKLRAWIKQPAFSKRAQDSVERSAARRIVAPITELLQHPGWQVAATADNARVPLTLPQLNEYLAQEGYLLHDLRKQIKRVRYQSECFRAVYGITYAAQIREFRRLQSILGELQDQIVISDFLASELGDTWPQQLPSIDKAFQASRVDLWQQWQPYQRKYLNLSLSSNSDPAADTLPKTQEA